MIKGLPVILFSVAALAGNVASAQLNINNAQFFIEAGATVTVQGDLTSNTNILGTGKIILKGSGNQNVNMNGNTIPTLEIDNAANTTLTGPATIGSELIFTNGLLQLGNHNLTLSNTAPITGGASNKFIVTNGTGAVKKNGLSGSFTYHVGYSASEYNPLTLDNTGGTADNYTVKANQNVLADGTNPATMDFANNSWTVSEDAAGGSNLTMMAGWDVADELTNFDRSKSGIARYVSGTDWDLPASQTVAASGSDPFVRTRTGVTTLGTFAVADRQYTNRATLSLKAYLHGAYYLTAGTTGGLMRDNLRANGALPTTQPYSTGKFAHQGVDGGTETANASVFGVAADPANSIVDWVFVTLFSNASTPVKLQTRSALIQRDGDIVDVDGVSPLSMPIDANGTYHVSVGHRNHLSARTPNASPVNMTEGGAAATWDFTTGVTQAYKDPAIATNPLISVTTGGITKSALIGGNVDGMTNTGANGRTVIYSGSGNDKQPVLTGGLSGNSGSTQPINSPALYASHGRFDLNMNGTIVYSGSGNDPAVVLHAVGGDVNITAREHQ
jgi:hypothetical protein